MTTPAPETNSPRTPIFLIGRFGSGTTMFWKLFRQFPAYTCYYEPFHESLLDQVKAGTQGSGASQDYYSEYRRLDQAKFNDSWKPWFAASRFWLKPGDPAQDMEDYLRFLIQSATARPVFKIVRADFRAAWLADRFPEATIIHLVRSPRDLWTSSTSARSELDDSQLETHSRFGTFRTYLDQVANDLGLAVPGHPYRLFYMVWKLSRQSLERVASIQWWYEDAVRNFPLWGEKNLIKTGLCPSLPRFQTDEDATQPRFHPSHWYQIQEEFVSDFLQRQKDFPLADFVLGPDGPRVWKAH